MKKNKYFSLLIAFLILLFTLTSCNNNKLDTPKNLSADINNRLSWDKIDNARSYTLEIKSITDDFEKSFNTRKNYYLLDSLQEGDYNIRIIAYGDIEKTIVSDWSEVFEFHRDYENGCTYKLINNNSEYQVYSGRNVKNAKIEIQSTYRGKPVVEIADGAFRGNGYIEEVVIADSIKRIGDNAFYNCGNLTKVVLPNDLETLGHAAFQSCKMLPKIELPDSLEIIDEGTFTYCYELASVKFPKNLKEIGAEAFDHCLKLNNIDLPDSLEKIGTKAFSNDSSLSEINIPSNLSEISNSTFSSCTSLKAVNFSSNSKLTKIYDNAFNNCDLTSIVIPEGVTLIDDECFISNKSLNSVSLPTTIEEIGSSAFNNTKIVNDQLEEGKPLAYVDKWVVNLNPLAEIKYLGNLGRKDELLFEDGTVGIADVVFAGYENLVSLSTPSSLKYIGKNSFNSCVNLIVLDLNEVKKINDYAFAGCSKLSSYNFGDSLENIGNYSFYGCTLLSRNTLYDPNNIKEDFTLPNTVKKVGTYAFKNTGFWNDSKEDLIYVGNWIVGLKENLSSRRVTIKEGTRGISDYAFYKNDSINTITGLGYVNYIGYGAFYMCSGIWSITLGDNIKNIEDFTFYKCANLNQVIFNSRIESLGFKAFYGCSNLEVLDFSKCTRLSEISDYSFYNCSNLTTIKFSNSIKKIGEASFAKCINLQDLALPDSIESIGIKSFYNCSALTNLTIGTGLSVIPERAFCGTNIVNLVIPSNIKEIGKSAFYNTKTIETLTLNNGLEKIGAYAFYGLENLDVLFLPETVDYIDKFAFSNCSLLTSIILPDTIKTIKEHAFFGCKSATIYTTLSLETIDNNTEYNWHKLFNSSKLVVVYNAELSEDNSYVVSFVKNKDNLANFNEKKLITSPKREGYTFDGWYTVLVDEEGNESNKDLTAEEILGLEDNTKVFIKWKLGNNEE